MTPKPPQGVREAVLGKLYARLDALLWEQLSSREKSVAYTQFVDDPEIGGALSTYMDPGKIRVWIKDGPAKEYIRAIEGVGTYAQYTNRALPSAVDTVTSVLGKQWSLVADSAQDKPMRCLAVSSEGERRFVVWGPYTALKELVWHVLLHRIRDAEVKPLLVVTRPSIAPLQTAQRKEARALAELIGAEFKSVVRTATQKSAK